MSEEVPASPDFGLPITPDPAQESVPFKQFKHEPDLRPGVLVTKVKPGDLWASQTWVDPVKIASSVRQIGELTPEQRTQGLLLPAYWQEIPATATSAARIRLVLADRHHRAIVAWDSGIPLNVSLLGALPEKTMVQPLSALRHAFESKAGLLDGAF